MRPIRALCAALAGTIVLATGAAAQDWPTRPILVVSPFAAGAANEIVARLVLDQVGQQIGQTFVIENRAGGGGIVGVASVVRADPTATLVVKLGVDEFGGHPAQIAALRRAARSRADRDVRRATERAGGGAVEEFQDRADLAAAKPSRHAELRSAGIGPPRTSPASAFGWRRESKSSTFPIAGRSRRSPM